MIWVLLIGVNVAIAGYTTKDSCLEAAKAVKMEYIVQCIPLPSNGEILLR